jgi:hypothetical protein
MDKTMPRKKMDIHDAFDVINKASELLKKSGVNIKVTVESVKDEVIDTPKQLPDVQVNKHDKRRKSTTVVTLRARHTINDQVYGPGVNCIVPIKLAKQLLWQDQQAVKADEDFLCKEDRSYMVIRREYRGRVANIGAQVGGEFFDDSFGDKVRDIYTV